MNKLTLKWEFNAIAEDKVERYCHNCSKKVVFSDSMKRRRNVNGKNIYEYAIYKCERDHTWNRPLNNCGTQRDRIEFLEDEIQPIYQYESPKELLLSETMAAGVEEIEIYVQAIKGRHRLDKLLAQHIIDLSRTQIALWIDGGKIQVDNCNVKPDTRVKNQQTIKIKL
jgi:hypothetical protein